MFSHVSEQPRKGFLTAKKNITSPQWTFTWNEKCPRRNRGFKPGWAAGKKMEGTYQNGQHDLQIAAKSDQLGQWSHCKLHNEEPSLFFANPLFRKSICVPNTSPAFLFASHHPSGPLFASPTNPPGFSPNKSSGPLFLPQLFSQASTRVPNKPPGLYLYPK